MTQGVRAFSWHYHSWVVCESALFLLHDMPKDGKPIFWHYWQVFFFLCRNKCIFLSHPIAPGVTKQVGDALLLEGQQRTGRVVSIGIAPWGIVERNHELLGHNRDVPCHSISSPRWVEYFAISCFFFYLLVSPHYWSYVWPFRSKLAVLNNRHAYFLLVDNGTQGKYGAEIILRRKLEKYISNLKLHPCKL